MNNHFHSVLLENIGASKIIRSEMIQELWSGYGELIRVHLAGSDIETVIVKHIQLTQNGSHPRGWNTDIGHQRKLKSYQVETKWYEQYSSASTARLPKALAIEQKQDEMLIVMEDLDQAGYPLRKSTVTWIEIKACIKWLAEFHASFMGVTPHGLWEIGTYWHLDTRPQELAALSDQSLKKLLH